ncbi:MAG: FAD-dependent oxidoreductase [Tissierellaceae bacterium]|nr:FAD-dependent oxidoreductase [Tissierellaceae bacterium]
MYKIKYLIIGNGIAGLSAARELRRQDKESSITIISQEKYPTYYRMKLTEALCNDIQLEDLLVNNHKWYQDNNINLILGNTVTKVIPEESKVVLDELIEIAYDKLLIATGSSPFIPPISGINKKGVFALRNFDDLNIIRSYVDDVDKVIVIGGGLLGIEAAWSLKVLGKKVSIIEFAPYLLPRQLDRELGEMLAIKLSEQDINIHLPNSAEEILGKDSVLGIRIQKGDIIKADAVLISTGIVPNIDLVKASSVETNRGIIVDKNLKTNIDNIYAAGDVAEYNGLVLGLWTTSNEQGRIAAANMLGENHEYSHPKPFSSLRIGDINLFSAGNILDYDNIYECRDEKHNIIKKIFIKDNRLVGAILFGDIKEMNSFKNAVFLNEGIDSFIQDRPSFNKKI